MRVFLALYTLFALTACEASLVRASSLGHEVGIDRSHETRETCLGRNAAADGVTDPTALAHAVALACKKQTEQLISATDQSGDAKVATSIRQDTEFRALGFVMKARG
jgi:hypothetical protein